MLRPFEWFFTREPPLSGPHKFIAARKVLRLDGTLSEASNLDWFESRVAYPDWAAEGAEDGRGRKETEIFPYEIGWLRSFVVLRVFSLAFLNDYGSKPWPASDRPV